MEKGNIGKLNFAKIERILITSFLIGSFDIGSKLLGLVVKLRPNLKLWLWVSTPTQLKAYFFNRQKNDYNKVF
jgi:hypothetical protein